MKKVVLVTGGAGYIGSHTSFLLCQQGYSVVILDDFVYNQPRPDIDAVVLKGDFADTDLLDQIFSTYQIDVVMHFAAFIEVGESVKYPQKFYENNVIKTIRLLNYMLERGVKKFIFSSSCAVYGVPNYVPINEQHPYVPINSYGKNKLVVEYALQDYAQAYGLQYVSLRYFNAAGCLINAGLGEWHYPESHVIPNLVRAALSGKDFFIFGDDYETVDGTCVRDYVHVADIALAHVLAYGYLQNHSDSQAFNLGSGAGYSVRQLIEEVQKVSGNKIQTQALPHRVGDVAILVADNAKIKKVLGWQARHSDLGSIMASAYDWEKRRMLYYDVE